MKGKKINVNQLIRKVEKEIGLTKEQRLERIIDLAYGELYKVKENDWITTIDRAEQLTKIAEKEVKKSEKLKIRWGVNELLRGL